MNDVNLKIKFDRIFTEFVESLENKNFSNSTISGYSQAAKHFLGYLVKKRIKLENVDERIIMDFAIDRFARGNSGRTVDDYVYRVLFFLNRYGLKPISNKEIRELMNKMKKTPSMPSLGKAPIPGDIGYAVDGRKLKELHKKFHPRG
jgi:site-specific recombinase XerD